MTRAVLLFARSPEAEARSKRLPIRRAAPLFSALVSGWADSASKSGATLMLACDGASENALVRATGKSAVVIRQRGTTFGDRLANAAAGAFRHGATMLLIVGIDSPAPSSVLIEEAFNSLLQGIPVIGPARDGGLYLIGLTRPERDLLETIRVGDSDLIERCRAHFGDRLLLLPTTSDLDSASDLRFIAADPDELWAAYRSLLCAEKTAPCIPLQPHSSFDVQREPSRAPPMWV